jgi:hypothetical protein
MLDLRGRVVACVSSTSREVDLGAVLGLVTLWFSLSSAGSTAIAVSEFSFSSLKIVPLRVDRLERLEGSSGSNGRGKSQSVYASNVMCRCAPTCLASASRPLSQGDSWHCN